MRRFFLLPSFLALFLALCIALPGPTLALRNLQPVQNAGLEEQLTQTLGRPAAQPTPSAKQKELPLDWVARAIRFRIDKDRWVESKLEVLRKELKEVEKAPAELQQRRLLSFARKVQSFKSGVLEGELGQFEDVTWMTTDEGTAIAPLFEFAEDLFFTDKKRVTLGMLKVPLLDLKKMITTYGLSENFPDDFKRRLVDAINRRHPLGPSTHPLEVRVASPGGRILLAMASYEEFQSILSEAIAEVEREVGEEYAKQIRGRDAVKRRKAFLEGLRGLLYFASHVDMDLRGKEVPRKPPLPDPTQILALQRALNEGKPKDITLMQLEKLEKKRPHLRTNYARRKDEWLRNQRKKIFDSVVYWLDQFSEERNVPEARGKAGTFIELALLDAWRRLNERLRPLGTALDPDYDPELSRLILEEIKPATLPRGISDRIFVLGDHKIRILTGKLRDNRRWRPLAKLYEILERGRQETVPIANYHTGRLPRPRRRLQSIENPHHPEKTYLRRVAETLEELARSPSLVALNEFEDAYLEYRLAMSEALALAPRDPRLPELHKFDWMDHVLLADERGQWAQWKKHLEGLLREYPKHLRQRAPHKDPNKDGRVTRLRELIHLLQPKGVFVFRRSEGDEIGAVLKIGEEYWLGLMELRRAGTWLRYYPTDPKDTQIHKIYLGSFKAAQRQVNAARRRPGAVDGSRAMINYLEEGKGVIKEIAPGDFPSEDKVKEKLRKGNGSIIRRMPTFYPEKGDTSARYAQSPVTGHWIYQDPSYPTSWIPLEGLGKAQTPSQLGFAHVMAELSATRNYSGPIRPGKLRKAFEEAESLAGDQKQNPEWDKQVMSTEQIKDLLAASQTAGMEEPGEWIRSKIKLTDDQIPLLLYPEKSHGRERLMLSLNGILSRVQLSRINRNGAGELPAVELAPGFTVLAQPGVIPKEIKERMEQQLHVLVQERPLSDEEIVAQLRRWELEGTEAAPDGKPRGLMILDEKTWTRVYEILGKNASAWNVPAVLLGIPDGVRKELEALVLSDPDVVVSYLLDLLKNVHYLVMERLEGTFTLEQERQVMLLRSSA